LIKCALKCWNENSKLIRTYFWFVLVFVVEFYCHKRDGVYHAFHKRHFGGKRHQVHRHIWRHYHVTDQACVPRVQTRGGYAYHRRPKVICQRDKTTGVEDLKKFAFSDLRAERWPNWRIFSNESCNTFLLLILVVGRCFQKWNSLFADP